MKQLVVLSGKGGTGKTSITASFAKIESATSPLVTVDCDVDAANLALLMPGEDIRTEKFWSGKRAVVQADQCITCFLCRERCPSNAITILDTAEVDPFSCEGCAVCSLVCPTDAIFLMEKQAGIWMERKTESGPLVHARLGVAQDNSGKLVAEVRKQARRIAQESAIDLILIDGPPGVGCPVHASLTDCDLALLVTEPTPSGEHDLCRVLELLHHFNIPALILINKYDLSSQYTKSIRSIARNSNSEVIAEVPFCADIPRALAKGKTPLDVEIMKEVLQRAWKETRRFLGNSTNYIENKYVAVSNNRS